MNSIVILSILLSLDIMEKCTTTGVPWQKFFKFSECGNLKTYTSPGFSKFFVFWGVEKIQNHFLDVILFFCKIFSELVNVRETPKRKIRNFQKKQRFAQRKNKKLFNAHLDGKNRFTIILKAPKERKKAH